jgi:hypothetical protein
MSYVDIVICIGPLPILETWPPIYMGQERTERDKLRVNQSSPYVYFQYTPCLTDFTFEFIRRPTPPILSPSYWTFVELTLVTLFAWNPTFEFTRCPLPLILSPSPRTFAELTLVNYCSTIHWFIIAYSLWHLHYRFASEYEEPLFHLPPCGIV